MTMFEDLMNQIESDKNELFAKIRFLEDENEGLLNEKHSLKIELTQLQVQRSDLDVQLRKTKEQLAILESINDFKQDELQDLSAEGKSLKAVTDQLKLTQKVLSEMRTEEVVLKRDLQTFKDENIELKSDLEKEQQLVQLLRKELNDVRNKYSESLDYRKQELGFSNIMASKMFAQYKMRESTNPNRVSAVVSHQPMSFYGEPGAGRPGGFGANLQDPLKVSTFDQARDKDIHQSQFRATTRESTMLSSFG
jgi:chromosome segregation ATPase